MTIKEQYELDVYGEIQYLTQVRVKTKMSQQELANKLNVNIKTIQRFESYNSKSGYLIFGYKQILNEINKDRTSRI